MSQFKIFMLHFYGKIWLIQFLSFLKCSQLVNPPAAGSNSRDSNSSTLIETAHEKREKQVSNKAKEFQTQTCPECRGVTYTSDHSVSLSLSSLIPMIQSTLSHFMSLSCQNWKHVQLFMEKQLITL